MKFKSVLNEYHVPMHEYVICFGDGSSAASRGMEMENDCEIIGEFSCDAVAYAAACYANDLLNEVGRELEEEDVISFIWDYMEDDDISFTPDMSDWWKESLTSMDIGGGAPLVYLIMKDGEVLYSDTELDHIVHGISDD